MLSKEFIANQIKQIDLMLDDTRTTIERAMVVEEQLVAQREKWLGKLGMGGEEPFLIGLPSLYEAEQVNGNLA